MTTEYQIIPGIKYVHKNDHRDGTHQKSQWTISEQEERVSFSTAYNSQWLSEDKGWGLHILDDTIHYLGQGINRQRQLFIAKFVDRANSNRWHGYPADYMINNHDIPDGEILSKWEAVGYITLSKLRKINRGQPCNL